MSIDRQQLEKEALEAVPAEDYYELYDNLDATSDAELEQIISDADDNSPDTPLSEELSIIPMELNDFCGRTGMTFEQVDVRDLYQ